MSAKECSERNLLRSAQWNDIFRALPLPGFPCVMSITHIFGLGLLDQIPW